MVTLSCNWKENEEDDWLIGMEMEATSKICRSSSSFAGYEVEAENNRSRSLAERSVYSAVTKTTRPPSFHR